MAIVLTKGLRMVAMTEDTRSWKGILGSVSWGPVVQPHQVKQCPVHATGSVAGGAKRRTWRLLLRFDVQTKFQLPQDSAHISCSGHWILPLLSKTALTALAVTFLRTQIGLRSAKTSQALKFFPVQIALKPDFPCHLLLLFIFGHLILLNFILNM